MLSCKNSTEQKIIVDQFAHTLSLEIEKLKNLPVSSCPQQVLFSNGYLVITDNYCEDKILRIIDLKSGQSEDFFRKGRGPAEMLSLDFAGHKQGDSLLFRKTANAMIWVNPAELWDSKQEKFTETERPFHDIFINCFHINDQWAYTSLSDKGFLVFTDNNGELVDTTPFYSLIDDIPKKGNIAYTYYSNTTYEHKNGVFVSALRYFPIIKIISGEGKIKKIIQSQKRFKNPEFDDHGIAPQPETTYFYDSVLASENYIYALQYQASISDLNQMNFYPSLEVFDYKGNAHLKIQFSEPFGSIDIDFVNGVIYGGALCQQKREYSLARVIIPDEFKKFFIN